MASSSQSVREWEATLVVDELRSVADGVVVLRLSDPDGNGLPQWTPGAHIDVIMSDSLVRQYSLCSSPRDTSSWRIGVLHAPDSRGGSEFIHTKLSEGASVRVRGPRNHFALVSAPRYLFIAGGIGITPLMPMIEAVDAVGADWELVYGGRSRDSMGFRDELDRYGDRVRLWPQDELGMLDLESLLGKPQPDTLVYCCGPEALLGAVEERCAGWPAGSLHLERFAAKPQGEPSAEALEEFEVVCRQSGVTVTIPPDGSILEELEEAGVDVYGSCYQGTCGSCESTVLEGEPDHRDSVLTQAEKDDGSVMMICVSRSRSKRLVLDV